MANQAKGMGLIEGIRVGKDKVKISHLQFTDHTLLFCLGKKQIFTNYRRLLDVFGAISDPDINYSKSALIPLCYEHE